MALFWNLHWKSIIIWLIFLPIHDPNCWNVKVIKTLQRKECFSCISNSVVLYYFLCTTTFPVQLKSVYINLAVSFLYFIQCLTCRFCRHRVTLDLLALIPFKLQHSRLVSIWKSIQSGYELSLLYMSNQ